MIGSNKEATEPMSPSSYVGHLFHSFTEAIMTLPFNYYGLSGSLRICFVCQISVLSSFMIFHRIFQEQRDR